MKIHVVGGFLGSGKTTAISAAANHLASQDQRVGIVTNDQGKFLVDTTFFRQQSLPTGEVVGGCFCCNYHDLDARINDLHNSADVIFAETVGSCADLVATVIKPLQQFRHDTITFSVFTDVRLLRAWLRNDLLPLGDDIVYIFGKQIEEADILILNKSDLLTDDQLNETEMLLQARFPNKRTLRQNSLVDVTGWVQQLAKETVLVSDALTIDYDRYGAGEAQLAWLDEEITLSTLPGEGRNILIKLIDEVLQSLREFPIGHLKFFAIGGHASCKISFTTLDQPGWEKQVPSFTGQTIRLLVNARVETEAHVLREIIEATLKRAQLDYQESEIAFFHPGFPKPVYRLT